MVKARYMVTIALTEEVLKKYEELKRKKIKTADMLKKGIEEYIKLTA